MNLVHFFFQRADVGFKGVPTIFLSLLGSSWKLSFRLILIWWFQKSNLFGASASRCGVKRSALYTVKTSDKNIPHFITIRGPKRGDREGKPNSYMGQKSLGHPKVSEVNFISGLPYKPRKLVNYDTIESSSRSEIHGPSDLRNNGSVVLVSGSLITLRCLIWW